MIVLFSYISCWFWLLKLLLILNFDHVCFIAFISVFRISCLKIRLSGFKKFYPGQERYVLDLARIMWMFDLSYSYLNIYSSSIWSRFDGCVAVLQKYDPWSMFGGFARWNGSGNTIPGITKFLLSATNHFKQNSQRTYSWEKSLVIIIFCTPIA